MLGDKVVKIGGQKQRLLAVSAKRTPIAGYTSGELSDIQDSNPQPIIYFSKDGRYLPVLFQLPFLAGNIQAVLTKECAASESCLLGNQE